MFTIFLARIIPTRRSIDEYVWIVVGDIPPAYLVTDDYPSPKQALEGYIWEGSGSHSPNKDEVLET